MIRKSVSIIFLVFTTIIIFTSCLPSALAEKDNLQTGDGKYDSEFPNKAASPRLEQISNSIKLINSIAFYESLVFDQKNKFTVSQAHNIELEKIAIEKVYFNRTASGSGTIVLEDRGLVGLISVAHIVSFPDTVFSYFVNPDGTPSKYVESISIKLKQSNYVPDFPEGGELNLIAIDKALDLALLGKKYSAYQTSSLHVFNFPWGKSSELEWGTFVYVFGFPMNYKMLSTGIVSSPGKEKNSFLIDAVFNRGYSGGIVLEIRDGIPNFELVGIVKSVPADFEYTVRPLTKEKEYEYNPMLPYKGEVYIEKQQIPRVGITKVIGIEALKDFLIANKDELISIGYDFRNLFNIPTQTILKKIH